MPETYAEAALTLACEMQRLLMETDFHMKNGLSLGVAASVGLATFPVDGTTVHAIIGVADTRMYKVKSHGRGHVWGA
jgi:diguanylate cyclase (GGDEF)-like protein